jgi:hypothetical protein
VAGAPRRTTVGRCETAATAAKVRQNNRRFWILKGKDRKYKNRETKGNRTSRKSATLFKKVVKNNFWLSANIVRQIQKCTCFKKAMQEKKTPGNSKITCFVEK